MAAWSTDGHTSSRRVSSQLASIDALFQPWDKEGVPGCALGIDHGRAPPIFRAYGSADLEHGVPIRPDTVFEAGSVSKQFTAALALILIEQGRLALDDDVRKYIPELPDYGSKITVAQLLDHTSGLRDWSGVVEIAGWPRTTRVYTGRDALAVVVRQKSLNFQPGSAFSYTNTGYILLANMVERISGESLAMFSRAHLFNPLGLTHTQWREDFTRVVKQRAVAYTPDPDGFHQFMPFDNVIGPGGLLTTVGDLLKWNEALDAGALGPFVTTELQRVTMLPDGRKSTYARGLYVGEHQTARKIWHAGETAGYEAFLARYPDRHVSIALLCNAGEAVDVEALGDKLADIFIGEHPKIPAVLKPALPTAALDEAQLAAYAGQYFDSQSVLHMDLVVKDGGLQRVSDGQIFVPVAAGVFRSSTSTISFHGNDDFVRDFVDGRTLNYRKIHRWRPDTGELSSFTGRYWSNEATATYVVTVMDGQLAIQTDDRPWNHLLLDPVTADTFSGLHHAYHFIRDDEGRVSTLDVSNGWEHVFRLSFRRVGDDEATQKH